MVLVMRKNPQQSKENMENSQKASLNRGGLNLTLKFEFRNNNFVFDVQPRSSWIVRGQLI